MTMVSIVVKFAAYTYSSTDICILFETLPMLLLLFDLKHSRTALTVICTSPLNPLLVMMVPTTNQSMIRQPARVHP